MTPTDFIGLRTIERFGRPAQLFFEKPTGPGRGVEEQHAARSGAGVLPGVRHAARQEGAGARAAGVVAEAAR